MFSNGRINNRLNKPRRRGIALLTFALLAALAAAAPFTAAPAIARGGQAADDCPPGSKDPDCK